MASKKRGRPRRTRSDAKARGVRLTDAEYAAVMKRAGERTFSDYVRECIEFRIYAESSFRRGTR
jgi:hypothetical protein